MNARQPVPPPLEVPGAPPAGVVRTMQRITHWLGKLLRRMQPPQIAALEIANSRWLADALGAFARLGVAEALADGPRDVDEVASELDVHGPSLYRLLRALAREGLLTEKGRSFGLTATTRSLIPSEPNSMHAAVLNMTAEHNVRTWAQLHRAVQTGEAAWGMVYDEDMWSYFRSNPEAGEAFHGAMTELTRDAGPGFARAYDFSKHERVVDLGGGRGQLLSMILAVHESCRGVLVDEASVLDGAPEVLAMWGVAERVDRVPGDVFAEVPEGHDCYVAKHVLHGCSDETAGRALDLWHGAMADDGRLVLVEAVIPGPGRPSAYWLDLQMLVSSNGGRERTREEWQSLLSAHGFTLETAHATASPFDVLVARKA